MKCSNCMTFSVFIDNLSLAYSDSLFFKYFIIDIKFKIDTRRKCWRVNMEFQISYYIILCTKSLEYLARF